MAYAVAINRSAERELKPLAPDIASAQSQRLKGSTNFRLRVGDYRVIYSVDDAAKKVTITAVGHRCEVYCRRLSRFENAKRRESRFCALLEEEAYLEP